MSSIHERDQILPSAETRIDFKKVLNRVTMERVEMRALLKDRTDPQSADAQRLEIIKLRGNTRDRTTLKTIAAALRPLVEAESCWPGTREIAAIKPRAAVFLSVA